MMVQAKDKRGFWQNLLGRDGRNAPQEPLAVTEPSRQLAAPEIEIAPNDPIVAYFASASGVVEIDKLDLDSPALRAMKAADIKVVVPLVSQGELIRASQPGAAPLPEYSADDLQAPQRSGNPDGTCGAGRPTRPPAAATGPGARAHRAGAQGCAPDPTDPPAQTCARLAGYQLAAYYQPAREVGGDFYDFLELDNGHLGLVVGDVTDGSVPAAIVMATTHTCMLRASAQRLDSPGEVLKRVNDVIVRDIPPNMFITCLYAILDPETGLLRFANAGHDLPYREAQASSSGGAEELRATGMPLGLLPGMSYEEKEIVLQRGDSVLFYSDGWSRPTTPSGEYFGFPAVAGAGWGAPFGRSGDGELPSRRACALYRRPMGTRGRHHPSHTGQIGDGMSDPKPARTDANLRRTLAEFSVPSEPGNERRTMEVVPTW